MCFYRKSQTNAGLSQWRLYDQTATLPLAFVWLSKLKTASVRKHVLLDVFIANARCWEPSVADRLPAVWCKTLSPVSSTVVHPRSNRRVHRVLPDCSICPGNWRAGAAVAAVCTGRPLSSLPKPKHIRPLRRHPTHVRVWYLLTRLHFKGLSRRLNMWDEVPPRDTNQTSGRIAATPGR